jgi:hypothetical protein
LQSTFSSSRLARLLGAWTPVDAEPSGMDVAERLGLWLNAFDAIGLQAAHQTIRAIRAPAPRRAADRSRADTVGNDFQRLRATLAKAIAQPIEDDGTYTAFQQRHHKLQRDMEQAIGPFRDHVRQMLGGVSARLRQLAALDAVLEQALAGREQKVLPAVGAALQRRFKQLRADAPQDGAQGDWLHAFREDWQQALLAELDLRLEPVAGLLDALHNESKNRE